MGVPYPDLAGVPGQNRGTLQPGLGYNPSWDWCTPTWDWSIQLGRDLGPVTGTPPRKDMGPVEVLWDEDGMPPRV